MTLRVLKSPEKWHKKRHRDKYLRGIEPEDCWYCQRAQAHCRSKRVYPTIEMAVQNAHDLNVRDGWVRPLRPYWCRWCNLYHLATATKKGDRRKVERQRRKWLIANLDDQN